MQSIPEPDGTSLSYNNEYDANGIICQVLMELLPNAHWLFLVKMKRASVMPQILRK